jgi:anti-anti-sigma factor
VHNESLKATVTTGDVVVLRLDGELAFTSGSMLNDLLDAALDVGKRTIVLDTSGITFIDLHGLDVLVDAQYRAAQREIRIVLRAPSRQVLDMLLLTGRDNLFPIDLTDAVAAGPAAQLLERLN